MKFSRILILAGAAWAGTMIYKLQYVPSFADADGTTTPGRSLYSDITGSGSLARTVRTSSDARTTTPPRYNTPSSSRQGKSNAVEDMAADDAELIQAAAKGDKNIVEQRLSLHVKVDSRDSERRTPLMYAAWSGYDDIANRLLAAGANPEFKDRDGNNAFDYAASRGLTDSLHFLLQRTHTTDDKHYMEYAAIIQATYAADPAALPEGSGKLAAINHVTPEGQAPLHIAAGNGAVALMQALVHRGANVNITNNNKQTPLHWAAWNNQTQAAKLLLDTGADVNLADAVGNTALMLTAQNNSINTAKILLAKGADRYTVNKDNKTASIIAEDNGFNDLANLLK